MMPDLIADLCKCDFAVGLRNRCARCFSERKFVKARSSYAHGRTLQLSAHSAHCALRIALTQYTTGA